MNLRTVALFGSLALFAPAVAAGATTTPAGVVQAFYQWYSASAGRSGGAFSRLGGARQLLTPSLYALLSRVRPYERTHDEVLDADPFVDAQIEASGMTVGAATVTKNAAVVPVTIRYSKAPAGGHVKVVVVKTAMGWRIDDFIGATGGSLRRTLARNMK
jgi:hypothetical protein